MDVAPATRMLPAPPSSNISAVQQPAICSGSGGTATTMTRRRYCCDRT
jgi:hypothetical protein